MAIEDKLQKLVDANIGLLPIVEITTHFIFERDGFVALVERRGQEFGNVGTAGLLQGNKVAPLVWRGAEAWFVAKDFEAAASPDQVEALRRFQSDLTSALA